MAIHNSAQQNFTSQLVCQTCGSSLLQDPSLNTVDESMLKGTESNTTINEESYSEFQSGNIDSSNVIRKEFHRKRLSQSSLDSNNGFYVFPTTANRDLDQKNMFENRLKIQMNERIYDFLSERCTFDHPLCQDCADNTLDRLDAELMMSTNELASYKNLLEELNKNNENDEAEFQKLREELIQLEAEEILVLEELKRSEKEYQSLSEETQQLEKDEQSLIDEEKKLLQQYNEQKRLLFEAEDEQKSIENQIKNASSQYEKLSKTNAFNAAFHIWHQENFVTINGFRLGSLPDARVEDSEINAGFGQAALLLNSLAKRIDLQFTKYRIVPLGSHSYMEDLSRKENGKYLQLPLYRSSRYFRWNNQFDEALVAFLDCVNQFKMAIETKARKFCLPYKIQERNPGVIVDSNGNQFSVRWQENSQEQWTKALKCVLTNLKWGLTWVSSQLPDDLTTSNVMTSPSMTSPTSTR